MKTAVQVRGCPAPLSPTNSDWNWRLRPVGSAMNNLWTEKCRRQVDNSETKVIKWQRQQLHELFIFLGAQISPSAPAAPHVRAHSGLGLYWNFDSVFQSCHFLKTVCNKRGKWIRGKYQKVLLERGKEGGGEKKKKSILAMWSDVGGRVKVDNDQ